MSVRTLKILFIVPGSGDPFYCGNCFRDNQHANALRKAGHEVAVMPLYLPLKDPSFLADTPLFFPATSLYLSQKYFKKKSLPRWMEKILQSDFSLSLAASFSGSTSAGGLEEMTLSMITGDDDVFRRQAHTLVEWIKEHERPDVIHLSSSLVIGIGKEIKKATHIPIVCSLQDEEVWIDGLEKEFAEAAWKGIRENMQYVDCFITSSKFYKNVATSKLHPMQPVHVVYPGLDTAKYASPHYPEHPTIGFFYRMNELNGLHILAEAFAKIKRERRVPHLRLRIGGGFTSVDKPFLRKVDRILSPYKHEVDWRHTYSLPEHAAFYKDISAICVPITFEEGVGLYLCEAFAAGRPAIEPNTGSFAEIVGDAGLLYEPNHSPALADAIERLFTTNGLWEQCREQALHLAETRYNHTTLAEKLHAIYADLL
ncbi:MAG: glycosyltransferase family 4 protein [Tannerellaceae bacterium]|jgi:glycosyltransferase involved in cell wall biosynthesis|nr:glycosyltransferase family 4 protein [Tannerellaceae bacterium]